VSEDIVDWGVRTHRYPAERAEYYRGRMSVDPQGTAELIKTLWPVPPSLAASLKTIGAASGSTAPRYLNAAVTYPTADAYRANPLVDDIRRERPALYAVAAAEASPPTLFSGGDLPVYTASGVESAVLARIPWVARHAVASAPTSAAAYAIIEDVSGEDGDLAAHRYANSPGNREYENRVRAWAIGPPALSKFDRQQLQRDDSGAMTEELFRDLLGPGTQP
jgi:hypothetical protein